MGDNEFGSLLRQLRLLRGMTQGELAKKAGVSLFSLAKYETGERRPPFRSDSRDTITRVAQAVGDKDGRLMQLAGFAPRTDERTTRTRPPFRELILTEPTLTAAQKRILVELYDSWVS